MKLSVKLTLAYTALIGLALSSACVAGYLQASGFYTDSIRAGIENSVNSSAIEVDGWVSAKLKIMETTFETLSKLPLSVGDLPDSCLGAFKSIDKEVLSIYFGMEDGRILDGRGWVPDAGFDPRQRPWYIEAKSADSLVCTAPYIDACTKKLTITFAKPIHDARGGLLEIMGEDILLDTLQKTTAAVRFRQAGNIMLVDSRGNILSHPKVDLLGKNFRNIAELRDQRPLSQDILTREQKITRVILDGKGWLSISRKIPSTDWRLICLVPENEVYQPLHDLLMWFFQMALTVIVLAVLISLFIARKITTPLLLLKTHAETVARGDLTKILPVRSSNSEIGGLTRSFNDMTQSLRTSHERQDDMVAQRTAELHDANLKLKLEISERQRTEEKLRHACTHDQLTGLYNRFFYDQEIRAHQQNIDKGLGLIICDVDGLKLINDTLGHEVGDEMLQALAGLLTQAVPADYRIARIGGDEFAILVPGGDNATLNEICCTIRRHINDYNRAPHTRNLSISMGWASNRDPEIHNVIQLFKCADDHMYREKMHQKDSARSNLVQTLEKTLESRDFGTEEHGKRMQDLVVKLGRRYGCPEHVINDLRLFAQFHDIGKIGTPDHILFKKGRLNDEEKTVMNRHSEIGFRIARASPDLLPIADWIRMHHERWNGTGYPVGLYGEDIPLACRILAIVDTYDAMTSDRPYRQALPFQVAIKELRQNAGIQFDPDLVKLFIDLLEQNGESESAPQVKVLVRE